MIKKWASFTLSFFVMLPAWGQALSDPTRPPLGFGDASTAAVMDAKPQERGLQSVIISPSRCAAIIDGKTVVLGAKHGSERLIEINARGVVLQGTHSRRTLTLFSKVGLKMTETLPQDRQAVECKFEQNMMIKNPAKQAGQEGDQ